MPEITPQRFAQQAVFIRNDKRWADRFIPQIKRILGTYLIGEAPLQDDHHHNTDLVVLTMNAVRVACRIRRYCYWQRYPFEFTIRAERESGLQTELTKLVAGWGDLMFYGFASEDESHLQAWHLLSLKDFRLFLFEHMQQNNGDLPGKTQTNSDGSSSFRVFDLRSMPASVIVACYPSTS